MFSYDAHNYWVCQTESQLLVGQRVTLHLSFNGRLDEGVVGFYKTHYVDDFTGQPQCVYTLDLHVEIRAGK